MAIYKLHHQALPYQEIGAFMAELRNLRLKIREGVRESEESLNALLLQFIILTAVRVRKAREARWKDFDLNSGLWACPPRVNQDR
jgi:integrase